MFTAPTAKNNEEDEGRQEKDIQDEKTREKAQTVWVAETTGRIHRQTEDRRGERERQRLDETCFGRVTD